MTKKERLRLAPSPTGFLHIGNLRSMLFTYFIAKKIGADLILRIEDTDQKRFVAGAKENFLETLTWIGLEIDEGPGFGGDYGPYIQTERLDIYQEYVKELIEKEKAYYCFCTPERLEKMRNKQQAEKKAPRYDRTCCELNATEIENKLKNKEPYVIRQKMPSSGAVKVFDELRGEIMYQAEDLDDQVLMKSNGIPTYQLASVVDDHLMEITMVTRGEEWIPSLPKNILLYQSFGWTAPKFLHFPNILSKSGGKLSKRHGDVSVESYREKGYLKEALLNFCALMGWHPKGDQEILNLEEIIKQFEIKDIGVKGPIFDTDKLDYLNGYYIRQKDLHELTKFCLPFLKKDNLLKEYKNNEYISIGEEIFSFDRLKSIIALEQSRIKNLSQVSEATEYFFVSELSYEAALLVWKKSTAIDTKKNLTKILAELEKVDEGNWTRSSIEESLMNLIKKEEAGVGDYLWPLRVSLSGRSASPGPFEIAEALSKKNTLKRIQEAIMKL